MKGIFNVLVKNLCTCGGCRHTLVRVGSLGTQQPCGAAFGGRLLCDELGRKIGFELADGHDPRVTLPLYVVELMNNLAARDGFRLASIVGEDRPQRLIEMLAVAEQRAAQHTFVHGA